MRWTGNMAHAYVLITCASVASWDLTSLQTQADNSMPQAGFRLPPVLSLVSSDSHHGPLFIQTHMYMWLSPFLSLPCKHTHGNTRDMPFPWHTARPCPLQILLAPSQSKRDSPKDSGWKLEMQEGSRCHAALPWFLPAVRVQPWISLTPLGWGLKPLC